MPSNRKLIGNGDYKDRLNAIISWPAQERLLSLQDGRDRSGCYGIVQISGNPRWMERGRYYDVYRIHQKEGAKVYLNRLLFFQSDSGWYVHGEPYITNIRALAKIVKHFRSPKMKTVKFRSKKHYKRTIGHRQEMTRILVEEFEVASVDDNWMTKDPLIYPLVKIEQLKTPSIELPKMKRNTIKNMTKNELLLLGENPLEHFDPILNKLIMNEQITSMF